MSLQKKLIWVNNRKKNLKYPEVAHYPEVAIIKHFGVCSLGLFSMSLCIKKKRSCSTYYSVTCFFQLIDCGSLCTPIKIVA